MSKHVYFTFNVSVIIQNTFNKKSSEIRRMKLINVNQLFFHFHLASCLWWIILHQQIRIKSLFLILSASKSYCKEYMIVWLSYLEYDLPAWHMMTLTSLGSKIPVLWLAPPSASLATNIVWGSSCKENFLNLKSSIDILLTNQIRIRVL